MTQDIEYPLGKSLLVYLLSGENMHEWADHLHEEFIKYAEKTIINGSMLALDKDWARSI